jgi:hypothetical protein
MTLVYPNIVPPNNLRLPDALTIKYGPAPLLARFVLEGDKAARAQGLRLRLRTDFDELLYLNKEHMSRGSWFRLVNMFNPALSEISSENAYWLSGENERGEIVTSWAGRVFYWPDTSLAEEACAMFYGRDEGQPCIVTAPAARNITGVVFCGGSTWVRPDLRGHQFSQLLPRIGRACALARWPVDWGIGYVSRVMIEKGIATGYGYRHFSHSVFYPGSPWGELEVIVANNSVGECYDDLADYLASELSAPRHADSQARSGSTIFDVSVTKTSSDGVFQGSSSLS